MESTEQPARRSLRAKPNVAATPAAAASTAIAPPPPPPTRSESPRSDVSEGRASRSSRLSNPEFAAKRQAFMAKVTAATKGSMDTYLTSEMIEGDNGGGGGTGKRKQSPRTAAAGTDDQVPVKRRRSTRTNSSGVDVQSDGFCWICHKEGEMICCETCPRVFHTKCLAMDNSPSEDWVCSECVLIMTADNMETRSRAMRLLTVDQLCTLLKHALSRMKSVTHIEPFLKPVDPLQFPAYKDYISCPMDLQSMERNIRRKQYGSTEAMLADCKWILHNCIIFNSPSSKLTSIAKNIVKVCKHEMQEIENCPDCYLNAHIKKDVWFTEACRIPHPLVWAKLKGFPFWPAKVMRVNADGNSDIRFFGAHDRAWIPIRDVFLYSEKAPSDIKKKRGNLDTCFREVEIHIKKLRDKFGKVEYAEHRTRYDHTQEEAMLKILFPNYTLPFEIGSMRQRARTYSFTGSERSRDATPTPSEMSGMDDEEDLNGEEETKLTEKIEKEEAVKEKLEPEKESGDLKAESRDMTIENSEEVKLAKPKSQQNVIEDEIEKTEMPTISPTKIENEKTELVLEDDPVVTEKTELVKSPLPESEPAVSKPEENTESVKKDEKIAKVLVEGRAVESPPCEVSSTTLTPGPSELEDKEKDIAAADKSDEECSNPKTHVGIIVDGNNEKVIFEDEDMDEIDDVEPVEEHASVEENMEKERMDVDGGNENVIEVEKTIVHNKSPIETSDEISPEKGTTPDDPSVELEGGVRVTVVDKKAKEKPPVDLEEDEILIDEENEPVDQVTKDKESDICVTVVEKTKTSTSQSAEKNVPATKDADTYAKEAVVKQPPADKTDSSGAKSSPPDPIVTISTINKVAKEPIPSSNTTSAQTRTSEAGRSTATSNAVQTPSSAAAHSSAGHRSSGYRGAPPPPIGPRGHMMMGGPPGPQGMMMRGQFRGAHPPGVGSSSHGAGPHGLPNLHPRPVGPLSLPPSLPSAAGPVAEQLNKVAGKLADYMKHSLEDLFRDLSQQGSSEATIKGLQIECEKMAWRHQQEIAEVKHNADLILMEMRGSMEQDKQRALLDCRKQSELEKQKAVMETKKKQWCSNCGKEAIFYCCWNTSYCDYPCQQAHWPSHMATCSQNSADAAPEEEVVVPPQPQHPMVQPPLPGPPPHYMGGGPRLPMHMSHAHQARMAAAASMGGLRFNMRPSLPGQMTFNRPYFM